MNYVPEEVLDQIEKLKLEGKYDEALSLANQILIKNPKNEDALFQVADIQYLKWEIWNAEKSVDFLLYTVANSAILFSSSSKTFGL